jgi:hypothetical protein
MEYVKERGHYPDVPYDAIIADFKKMYPRWLAPISHSLAEEE